MINLDKWYGDKVAGAISKPVNFSSDDEVKQINDKINELRSLLLAFLKLGDEAAGIPTSELLSMAVNKAEVPINFAWNDWSPYGRNSDIELSPEHAKQIARAATIVNCVHYATIDRSRGDKDELDTWKNLGDIYYKSYRMLDRDADGYGNQIINQDIYNELNTPSFLGTLKAIYNEINPPYNPYADEDEYEYDPHNPYNYYDNYYYDPHNPY